MCSTNTQHSWVRGLQRTVRQGLECLVSGGGAQAPRCRDVGRIPLCGVGTQALLWGLASALSSLMLWVEGPGIGGAVGSGEWGSMTMWCREGLYPSCQGTSGTSVTICRRGRLRAHFTETNQLQALGPRLSWGPWPPGMSWQGGRAGAAGFMQLGALCPGSSGRWSRGWKLRRPCPAFQPTCLAPASGAFRGQGVWLSCLGEVLRAGWGAPSRDPRGWTAAWARPPCTLSCPGPPAPCRFPCLHRPQRLRTCSKEAGRCYLASFPNLEKNPHPFSAPVQLHPRPHGSH